MILKFHDDITMDGRSQILIVRIALDADFFDLDGIISLEKFDSPKNTQVLDVFSVVLAHIQFDSGFEIGLHGPDSGRAAIGIQMNRGAFVRICARFHLLHAETL
jgi:hypothetical protein